MSAYLEVSCGEYHLLLPEELVQEVVSLAVSGDQVEWKGQKIPVVDLRRALDQEQVSTQHQLVVKDVSDEGKLLLVVDEVSKLHDISDEQFSPLPPLYIETNKMIDAVLAVVDRDYCLLRLNRAFTRALL